MKSALGDLHGQHDEFANFFGDVFDQLESLTLELFTRHKCLESRIQHEAEHEAAGVEYERQFRECLEELRELEAKVRSAHEETARIWSEISTTHQEFLQEHAKLHETQEEIRRISTEFRTMREGVEQDRVESRQRQESIQEHLQRLAGILAESAAVPSLSGRDEQLAQVIEATHQQQVAWQQDRAKLEAELETERQRAAQQNEALAEQRRLTAQQQAGLDGELKRMRSLLEVLLNNMNQPLGANSDDGNQTSASAENGALGSVFAQFQMLLRDHAQRRADKHKDTAKR